MDEFGSWEPESFSQMFFWQDIKEWIKRTPLRHLTWSLLLLRIRLLLIERRLNRGKKVDPLHPWLKLDVRGGFYLTNDEYDRYHEELLRIRKRATHRKIGWNVYNFKRGQRGWLWFSGEVVRSRKPLWRRSIE